MSLECVVSVLQRQELTAQMALANPRKRLDLSGKLFWKQPLRGVVANSVLKF